MIQITGYKIAPLYPLTCIWCMNILRNIFLFFKKSIYGTTSRYGNEVDNSMVEYWYKFYQLKDTSPIHCHKTVSDMKTSKQEGVLLLHFSSHLNNILIITHFCCIKFEERNHVTWVKLKCPMHIKMVCRVAVIFPRIS